MFRLVAALAHWPHAAYSLLTRHASCCRLEASQEREQLQARVTVLEGRVRFLEAGWELAPPLQQLPPMLEGGSCAQCACVRQLHPPALPWVAPPARPHMAVMGCHHAGHAAANQAALHVSAQHRLRASAATFGLEQQARSNPLFDTKPSAPSLATLQHHIGSPEPTGASQSGGQAGAAYWQSGTQALAADPDTTTEAPPAAQRRVIAAKAGAAVGGCPAGAGRQYGSTTELIAGMQARFSEAEGFLLSLQRL